MEKTVKLKILPTNSQSNQLEDISKEYINSVNIIVSSIVSSSDVLKLTSKDAIANMPSAVKTLTTDYQLEYLQYQFGLLRITKKSDKWTAQNNVPVDIIPIGIELVQ